MPLFSRNSQLALRLDRDYVMAADLLGDVRAAWLEKFPGEPPHDFELEVAAPLHRQCRYEFHEGGAPGALGFRAGMRAVAVTITEGEEPILARYPEPELPGALAVSGSKGTLRLNGTIPEARLAVALCRQLLTALRPADKRRFVIARISLASAEPAARDGSYEVALTHSFDGGPFRFELLRDGAPWAALVFSVLAHQERPWLAAGEEALKTVHLTPEDLSPLPTTELLKSVGIESDRVASRYAAILCRAARDALAGWSRTGVDPGSIGLYCPFAGVLQDQALLDLLADDREPIELRYRMRIPPLRHLRRASYVQAAWVSIQNDIRGPTHTFVHETEGLSQSLDQAWTDLDTGLVAHALVVAARASVDDEPGPERAVAALIHGAAWDADERHALESELLANFRGDGRIKP